MLLIILIILTGVLCSNPSLSANWKREKCIIQGSCNSNRTECSVLFEVRKNSGCDEHYTIVLVTRNGQWDAMRRYESECKSCEDDYPFTEWITRHNFVPDLEVDCYVAKHMTVFEDPRPKTESRLTK